MAKPKTNLKSEVVYVLHEENITGGGKKNDGLNKVQLRLISWNDMTPVLEKRQLRLNEDTGEWFCQKNVGMKEQDVQLIVAHVDKLDKLWKEWAAKSTEQGEAKDV